MIEVLFNHRLTHVYLYSEDEFHFGLLIHLWKILARTYAYLYTQLDLTLYLSSHLIFVVFSLAWKIVIWGWNRGHEWSITVLGDLVRTGQQWDTTLMPFKHLHCMSYTLFVPQVQQRCQGGLSESPKSTYSRWWWRHTRVTQIDAILVEADHTGDVH